jgi:hypothetical protein
MLSGYRQAMSHAITTPTDCRARHKRILPQPPGIRSGTHLPSITASTQAKARMPLSAPTSMTPDDGYAVTESSAAPTTGPLGSETDDLLSGFFGDGMAMDGRQNRAIAIISE